MANVLLVVVSVLVGIGRFTIPGHDLSAEGSAAAMAQIAMGIVLAYLLGRDTPTFVLLVLGIIEGNLLIQSGLVQNPTWPSIYEVLAHQWVGVLIGIWTMFAGSGDAAEDHRRKSLALVLLTALTVLEIGMFVTR
jgi:ABC-type iron transport system FetAB permease component